MVQVRLEAFLFLTIYTFNKNKKPVYRVFNSAFTLREHAQQHIKNKYIPEGSVINYKTPNEYIIFKVNYGSYNEERRYFQIICWWKHPLYKR